MALMVVLKSSRAWACCGRRAFGVCWGVAARARTHPHPHTTGCQHAGRAQQSRRRRTVIHTRAIGFVRTTMSHSVQRPCVHASAGHEAGGCRAVVALMVLGAGVLVLVLRRPMVTPRPALASGTICTSAAPPCAPRVARARVTPQGRRRRQLAAWLWPAQGTHTHTHDMRIEGSSGMRMH